MNRRALVLIVTHAFTRGGSTMRRLSALMLIALLGLLAAPPASAQPPITTCALTGVYVLSAALAVSGEAQFSGQFTFTPPAPPGLCLPGASGTVQLQLSILFAGSPTPSPFTGSFPYAVDATGGVTIGTGLIQGNVGAVADTGIAQLVVFWADPGFTPATVRFAGTAVRVNVGTTTGAGNTALGFHALQSTTTGFNNTATGGNALLSNTTGFQNTATGEFALAFNTTGTGNTATGESALVFNTTGSHNIALGASAGVNATTGSNNIYIGHAGIAAEANTIRIGTSGTQTATFIAGIVGAGVLNPATLVIDAFTGQLGTGAPSSQRFKEEIRDMGEASAGLLRLRPVTFRYKQPAPNGSKPLQYGLIAEEVAEVHPELVAHDPTGEPTTVMYHLLPAMLLNEVQAQHRRIEAQDRLIQAQQDRLEAQAAQLAELSDRLARLEAPGRRALAP